MNFSQSATAQKLGISQKELRQRREQLRVDVDFVKNGRRVEFTPVGMEQLRGLLTLPTAQPDAIAGAIEDDPKRALEEFLSQKTAPLLVAPNCHKIVNERLVEVFFTDDPVDKFLLWVRPELKPKLRPYHVLDVRAVRPRGDGPRNLIYVGVQAPRRQLPPCSWPK